MAIVAESISLRDPGLSDLGWSLNPLTWFGGDTKKAAPDAKSQGIFDEVQKLGRVKTTCMIRKLQEWAGKFLDVRAEAEQKRRPDLVQACDRMRSEINGVVDYLYNVIDFWFGGEQGKEGPVPSSACKAIKLDGVEQLGVAPLVAIGVSAAVAAIVTAGGVAAYLAYVANNHLKFKAALNLCKDKPGSKECEAAVAATKMVGEGAGDWLDVALAPLGLDKTKLAVGAVVVVGGFVAWKYFAARMFAQSIASGVRAGGGLRGLPGSTRQTRNRTRFSGCAQRCSGKAGYQACVARCMTR